MKRTRPPSRSRRQGAVAAHRSQMPRHRQPRLRPLRLAAPLPHTMSHFPSITIEYTCFMAIYINQPLD